MKLLSLLLACVFFAAPAAAAEYVVIVNPKSTIDKLSRDEVIDIFMGRTRKLPSGATAWPIDLAVPPSAKDQFYTRLVGKPASEINAYWARLIFSGNGSPPRQAESDDDVIQTVASLKGAIGYVDRKHLNKQVKVVFEFTE